MLAQQRVITPELLDHAPPEEARENLRDLVRVNRYFGGHWVLRRIFSSFVAPQQSFSVLDIGAASGDMGAALRQRYPNATVTSLDRNAGHLESAAQPKLAGDAFQLPFRDKSFDIVFSSLFLHHFSNDEVVRLLRGFGAVARRAVLAIDLERGPLAYYFMPSTQWLLGWKYLTVHDGQISVQAAFKKDELLALARQAGLGNAQVMQHRPWARLSLVALL